MNTRNKRPANSAKAPGESRPPQPTRTAKRKHPGQGLDRSTEGVIEATRKRQKPAPPGALPDRRTIDSRRRG